MQLSSTTHEEEAEGCSNISDRSSVQQEQRKTPLIRKRQHSLKPNIIPFHERNRLEFLSIILGGSALSFNSGFINGCTLLSFHPHPVSHVTGTTSHAGIDLASGKFDIFGIEVCLIMCFIFGSAITGYWMPANAFQFGRQYGPLFLIGSGMLLSACLTSYYDPESNWYFYLASMSSGLQNGMTTKYSGSIIRTTHLTGAATDIGLTLGRMAIGDYKDSWKLQVLVPIFFSFFTGGFLSKYAVDKLGRLSLMINVIIFFSIGLVYSLFVSYKLEISLLTAFLGSYRTAGQKLRDVTNKLNVRENLRTAIGGANNLKSKIHSKLGILRSRTLSPKGSVSGFPPTDGTEVRNSFHYEGIETPSGTEDLESPFSTLSQNPIHQH